MPSTAASLSIPDLAGKAVLVTGGSTGIGAALVSLCRAEAAGSACTTTPAGSRRGAGRQIARTAATFCW